VAWRDSALRGVAGPGTGGNRGAPPRGVDVKQPLRARPRGRGGLPDPSGAPETRFQDPRVRRPRIPGSGDPPSRGPRSLGRPMWAPGPSGTGPRAGVLHQPLAPGPRGTGWGVPGVPGVPKVAPGPCGASGASREARIRPSPGRGPETPRGAPARGVDVKPRPGRGPGSPKSEILALFKENARFWAFLAFLAR